MAGAKLVLYGIKNCDTMKKAFSHLDAAGVPYDFHDYKKGGADEAVLRAAIAQHGWEAVINRKGTTWRTLPAEMREHMDEARAITAALENPSLIKRPLAVTPDGAVILGFDEKIYSALD